MFLPFSFYLIVSSLGQESLPPAESPASSETSTDSLSRLVKELRGYLRPNSLEELSLSQLFKLIHIDGNIRCNTSGEITEGTEATDQSLADDTVISPQANQGASAFQAWQRNSKWIQFYEFLKSEPRYRHIALRLSHLFDESSLPILEDMALAKREEDQPWYGEMVDLFDEYASKFWPILKSLTAEERPQALRMKAWTLIDERWHQFSFQMQDELRNEASRQLKNISSDQLVFRIQTFLPFREKEQMILQWMDKGVYAEEYFAWMFRAISIEKRSPSSQMTEDDFLYLMKRSHVRVTRYLRGSLVYQQSEALAKRLPELKNLLDEVQHRFKVRTPGFQGRAVMESWDNLMYSNPAH